MRPQTTFNGRRNDDDNNNRMNIRFPNVVFVCPRCPAFFFTSHERDTHYFEEMLTIYEAEEAIQKLKEMIELDNNPINCNHCRKTPLVSKNFACGVEKRQVSEMPAKNFQRFGYDKQFKMIAPHNPIGVNSDFHLNHKATFPVLESDQEVTSKAMIPPPPPPPPPLSSQLWASHKFSMLPPPTPSQVWMPVEQKPAQMTSNLLSNANQSIQPILSGNPNPQFKLTEVDGLVAAARQEAKALSPGPLVLGLPISEAGIEATSLELGPPGLEKEARKKPKLDLNLKI